MTEEQNHTERLALRRKQLRYRAWHRGTQEMDLLLGDFTDQHIDSWDEAALDEFEQLLEIPDPDLYDLKTGAMELSDHLHSPILRAFIAAEREIG